MLAVAVAPPQPSLHRSDSAPRPRHRWPLNHSRSTSSAAATSSTTTTPATSASNASARPHPATSRPQLAAVAEPQPAPAPPLPSSSQPAASTEQPPAFDIHAVPAPELLKLLASLLQQIASTNDGLCPTLAPPSPRATAPSTSPNTHSAVWQTLTNASRIAFSSPTASLSFHARNVPTISLEAYLLRILKYCPIPNDVFLALLVYFDRMSKLAHDTTGAVFAIDSYNVHRLVIAGITVASKFLSDVFYTNTRYAKVGGLPQAELNQLELQFLLLNDFHLLITRAEMQKYAEQLMVYARARGQLPAAAASASLPPTPPPATPPAPVESSDAGETTDDEPTIRPDHSCASSETQSIRTAGDDTEADDTDAEFA